MDELELARAELKAVQKTIDELKDDVGAAIVNADIPRVPAIRAQIDKLRSEVEGLRTRLPAVITSIEEMDRLENDFHMIRLRAMSIKAQLDIGAKLPPIRDDA